MKKIIKIALFSSYVAAAVAQAAAGPGTSSANDVKLNTDSADVFVLIQGSQINPINSTAGFASQFISASGTAANGWSLAETVEYKDSALSLTDKVLGDGLSFSFAQAPGRTSGTWSITNTSLTRNSTLDLGLSFHAGNNVGSFLFNDQAILAGQTLTGNWAINWLNNASNANSVPLFSNLGIYTGQSSSVPAVPEASAYGMLLMGLGIVGYAMRRRRRG